MHGAPSAGAHQQLLPKGGPQVAAKEEAAQGGRVKVGEMVQQEDVTGPATRLKDAVLAYVSLIPACTG